MNLTNCLSDETNLLRSHYYVFAKPYDSSCSCFNKNRRPVFLHKMRRGYALNHFTHQNMLSIIRVLGFRYFGFSFTDITNFIHAQQTAIPNVTTIELRANSNEGKQHPILLPNNTVAQFAYTEVMKTQALPISKNEISSRNCDAFGFPITLNARQFDYATKSFYLIYFCEFINEAFDGEVMRMLQNPITAVFQSLSISFEIHTLMQDRLLFCREIAPSILDFIIADNFFTYAESLHLYNNLYTMPRVK